ncbi:hypothetical protein OOZ63_05065 [Paucibacter sp. PLA-PC-4]|uniref:hypothetical protein n=1 Tax=Paucibacter sp. PLA-PC-4 TaxID=2993655 RepID=UPI002248C7F1|nr:hypothetical protein [Paucibacter sp. PLA-PC-4]MCX2861206.1 hypothetical protein [Paucibacter sp. PLA-PC-4]
MDTNVLLPPRLSDILFDLFLEGLYHPRWTKTIEAEFIKNFGAVALAKSKAQRHKFAAAPPDPAHIAKANGRLGCFRSAAGPEHEVLLYDQPEYESKVPTGVNKGDIHVASAALVLHGLSHGEGLSDKIYVVSSNLVHLAVKDMKAIGIGVVSPGAFINELNNAAPGRVERALLKTANDLKAPPFTQSDLLGLLVVHGAKATANFYSKKWKVKLPERGPPR